MTNAQKVLPREVWLLGEKAPLEFVVNSARGQSMSGATCSLNIYNSSGSSVHTSSPSVTLSNSNTRADITTTPITTDTSNILASVGDYVVVFQFTVGNYVLSWQQPITVKVATSL